MDTLYGPCLMISDLYRCILVVPLQFSYFFFQCPNKIRTHDFLIPLLLVGG